MLAVKASIKVLTREFNSSSSMFINTSCTTEVVIFTNDAHALTLAANQRATFADEVCMGNSKLVLNGTAVNSTAAELNLLDGCSSAAGIACTGDITGVTAGTNLNGGGSSGSVTVNLDGDNGCIT